MLSHQFSLFFALSLLSAIVPKASPFVATPPSPTTTTKFSRSTKTTQLHIYRLVQEAISEAELICAVDPNCADCKVAWDIVEELEAADSHRHQDQLSSQASPQQTSNDHLSMDFVALMGSFDILSQKIDMKMDQLIATCEKLEDLGADPSVTELSQLAEQMKRGLEYVNNKLRE